MTAGAPTETELVGFLESLARPRSDDASPYSPPGAGPGALARIVDATRRSAALEVREGVVIGCGREIAIEPDASDVRTAPTHDLVATEPQTADHPLVTTQADAIGLPSHGVTVTHVDALAHFAVNGRIHGGLPAIPATAADPPAGGRIHDLRDGIVTRGVLLDVAEVRGGPWLDAGEAVGPDDLEAAEAVAGTRLGTGDALLLRTGWPARRAALGSYPEWRQRPGLHAATLPWLHDRGVAVVASDASHDAVPSGYRSIPMPIHTIGLVTLGLCLIDACDFERLAAACRERGRWTCLFVVAPLAFRNATGSPVNPLALL